MEDAHVVHLDNQTACFAVFDGHGGKEVALYAGKHVVRTLMSNESYKAG